MSDPNTIRMIHVMRPQDAVAAEEQAQFTKWSESDVRSIYNNPEAERLTAGPPPTDPEIARLLRIANEESPQGGPEIERLSRIAAQEAPKT